MATTQATFERRLAEHTPTNLPGRSQNRNPDRRGSERPDIAILVYDLRASGVVLNALRIAKAALQANLRTELWVMNDLGPMGRDLPAGLHLRRLHQGPPGQHRALASVKSIPALAAALRTVRPRALFSAGNHVHAFAVAGHRLARVPDVKLIGRVSNALAATAPRKRSGLWGKALRAIAIAWERMQFRAMDQLVAVSHELGSDLVTHGQVDSRTVAIIPNGVDAGWIAARATEPLDHPWFAPGAPPVVLAVGRLSRQKNFDQLIRAFAMLRQKRVARLVIIGHGKDKDRDALQAQARALGVDGDLWLAGYQANPYRFMARARLFAMTSLWEGGSNVLIEALACGLPIVATACPTGVREVLEGLPDGRLVAIGDAGATAEAMHELLVQPHNPLPSSSTLRDYQLSVCLARYQTLLNSAAVPA